MIKTQSIIAHDKEMLLKDALSHFSITHIAQIDREEDFLKAPAQIKEIKEVMDIVESDKKLYRIRFVIKHELLGKFYVYLAFSKVNDRMYYRILLRAKE
jgi:hypothetical protein